MNKELLIKTLAEVRRLRKGEVCPFTTEKAGILRAFLTARTNDASVSPEERKLHAKIIQVLRDWESAANPPKAPNGLDAKERRSQMALRGAIEKVTNERWDELNQDDIALIRASHEVTCRKPATPGQDTDRLTKLMESCLDKIDRRLAATQTGEAPGSLFAAVPPKEVLQTGPMKIKNHITPDEAFWEGKRTRLGNLQGIETDIQAVVVELEGETVIEGDIPEHALLVVKDGGVTVEGSVAGHLVAIHGIRISGNVQGGWVISTQGDISMDRILAGAHVVAMHGNVSCQYIEGADGVFAWGTLAVSGSIRGGQAHAPRIMVVGEVKAAELHSCGQIESQSFTAVHGTPSVICLRDSLTCEDYGRPMTKTMKAWRQRLRQLEILIETEHELDRFNENLARNCFRTALFYLMGGVNSANMALVFQGLQAKSIHLGQLLSLADGIAEYYSALDPGDESFNVEAAETFKQESLRVLSNVQAEIREFPAEFGPQIQRFLFSQATALATSTEKLHRSFVRGPNRSETLADFAEKLGVLQEELRQCETEIEDAMKKFKMKREMLDMEDLDSPSLQEMLDRIIQDVREKGDRDQLERVNSPLIRLLKDYAARFRRGIQTKTVDAAKEVKEILANLAAQAVIVYGDTRAGDCCVRSFHFDQGVVLTAVPGVTEAVTSNLGAAISISDDIEGETVFSLRKGIIQRHMK